MTKIESLQTRDLKLSWTDRFTLGVTRRSGAYLFRYRMNIADQWFHSAEHVYGKLEDERLQYFPGDMAKTPIVFIHGGGWVAGHMRSVAIGHGHFIRERYPLFNLNYPLAPEHPFPQPLLSCLKALLWIKQEHPHVESIHIMGDSAGGNIAVMIGLLLNNPACFDCFADLLPDVSIEDFPKIKTMVSIYGIMDRLAWTKNPLFRLILKAYGGVEALKKELSESRRLTPMDWQWQYAPPLYLACAERDPITQSSVVAKPFFEPICEGLQMKVYPGVRHGFYEEPGHLQSKQLKKDIEVFIEHQ